jgi:hypothetical protein
MIVHWDPEVSTLKIGIGGVNTEALTTSPGDLQDTQEDQRDDDAREELTRASFRGAGAAATRFARKPGVSKAVRAAKGNISPAGMFPMSNLHLYATELSAKPLRGRQPYHNASRHVVRTGDPCKRRLGGERRELTILVRELMRGVTTGRASDPNTT